MDGPKAEKILEIEDLASFERLINRNPTPYESNRMVLPGFLPDNQKNVNTTNGIPAFRNRFHLIYLILDGEYEVIIGSDHYRLSSNDLVIVPENMVYEVPHLNQCRSGYCINFLSELLLPLIRGPISSEFPYLDPEAEHVIKLNVNESKSIQNSFEDIIREYHTFYSSEKDNLLKHYLEILLIRIREIYRPYYKRNLFSRNKVLKIANRFKILVDKNIRKIRQVKDYASMLNISSGHLSHTVHEAFGKSPREVINDALLLEAKMLLSATDTSLIDIAFQLHFNDQSHFNHFIKHHTGLCPKELRKML